MILPHGVLVVCIATLQIGHDLGGSSSDVSVGMTNHFTKRNPARMRTGRGPLPLGLAQEDRTGPPARALNRVFKANCKLFHGNFSGMADLINFMARIHKTSLPRKDYKPSN